jgi:hypothetical protein
MKLFRGQRWMYSPLMELPKSRRLSWWPSYIRLSSFKLPWIIPMSLSFTRAVSICTMKKVMHVVKYV